MEDMERRIARGDLKQERAEAIKVRSRMLKLDELINNFRQCVISQQTVQLSFKRHKICSPDNLHAPRLHILISYFLQAFLFVDSEITRRT
jgi:hypothetical protein